MMILTRSNTLIAELNSNWGRIIRLFRTKINDMYVVPDNRFSWKSLFGLASKEKESVLDNGPPVFVHDIRLAFGEDKPLPPPGW